mgnify:CR=1 FL=1
MAVILLVVFSVEAFIPRYVGIAVIITSLLLIAFVGIQEVRHNMHKKTSKKFRLKPILTNKPLRFWMPIILIRPLLIILNYCFQKSGKQVSSQLPTFIGQKR